MPDCPHPTTKPAVGVTTKHLEKTTKHLEKIRKHLVQTKCFLIFYYKALRQLDACGKPGGKTVEKHWKTLGKFHRHKATSPNRVFHISPPFSPSFPPYFSPKNGSWNSKTFPQRGSIGILWKNPTRETHLIQPFRFPLNDLAAAARHRNFSGKGWGKIIQKCGKRKKQISGHFSFHRFHRLLS